MRRLAATVVLVVAGGGLTFVSASAVPSDPYGNAILVSDAGGVIATPESGASVQCETCSVVDAEAPRYTRRRALPSFVIDSKAAFVLDDTCDVALYGKNEHMRLPPASLTKMMTALVAVEQVEDLDQRVQVNLSARELKARTRSSVMGLEPGMEMSFRDLLYGLMLPSGNDAALVIAENASGSVPAFVDLMNIKASELGLADTRFANPHGLDNKDLYSTAHDLVYIGRAMMENPLAAEIARTPSYTAGTIGLNNGNKLLRNYEGAYGVKIGYTGRAAHTIVAAAERDGRRIYASVLGSKVSYADVTKLLDWAFLETPRSC